MMYDFPDMQEIAGASLLPTMNVPEVKKGFNQNNFINHLGG